MDEELKDVKFLPWVGDNYECGLRVDENGDIVFGTKDKPGKKILVLGESLYTNDPNSVKEDAICNLMKWYFDPNEEFEGWMNTYTKFIRSVAGKAIDRSDSAIWWNHLALYEYVQEPLTGPRFSPTHEQFKCSESAFFNVIEKLKPDYIIAWGQRLYNNLPQGGEQGDDLCVNKYEDWIETWIYMLGKQKITVLPFTHPSSSFSWEYWHQFLCKL
jgi:hypothetical protein